MTGQKNPKEQRQDKDGSIDVLPQVYESNDCLDVVGLR
jgi:hypothetical protein